MFWLKPPILTEEIPLVPVSLDGVPGLTLEPRGRREPAVCGFELAADEGAGTTDVIDTELVIIL